MESLVRIKYFTLFEAVSESCYTNDFFSFVPENSTLGLSANEVIRNLSHMIFAQASCLYKKVQNSIRSDFKEFILKNLSLIMVSSLKVSCEGSI